MWAFSLFSKSFPSRNLSCRKTNASIDFIWFIINLQIYETLPVNVYYNCGHDSISRVDVPVASSQANAESKLLDVDAW